MKIKSIYISQGLFCTERVFKSGFNLIFSEKNSTGKTTLMRCILYGLGYAVPGTKKFSIESCYIKIAIEKDDSTQITLCRSRADSIELTEADMQYTYFIIIGRISAGALLGMVQVSSNLANPLLIIFSNIPKIKSIKPIAQKLNQLSDYEKQDASTKKSPTFNDAICVENLHFSYDKENEVIGGISLSIEKGKKYAFVGKSGCGKSTLIKLIAGYYSDFTGNVLYDADSLSILDIDKITALSSIIHQNVYMFDESIFDNICLHEDYSEKELQSALSDSGLSSFIKQVPNGLEYHVGENGANLSGGQKQRIAVARALIRKKPLLILDEGTSAIDMQTAYDIESRLLAISDLTLLTITHNMSKDILELYDEIIFMAEGKIVEHGTFEALIAKHAAFYDFYQLKK